MRVSVCSALQSVPSNRDRVSHKEGTEKTLYPLFLMKGEHHGCFAGKILGIIAIIFVATSLMIAAIKNLFDLFF